MTLFASVDETIAAPAAAIWRVLTDFAHPERLAPTIDGADVTGEGVGTIRIVRSSRGLAIHEQLLECDAAGWCFRYAVLDSGDMPFAGVESYHCIVRLVPLGDALTEIHWRSEGDIDGPVEPVRTYLTALYRGAIQRIAEEIAAAGSAIDAALADAVAQGVAPGFVGMVASADGDLYAGAHGVRAIGGQAPITRDTIFSIASMTKLVTTVAVLQLVETGRLSLDAPVAGLLPELADPQVLDGFDAGGSPLLRPARGEITLRQLLTHRSGLGYDLMNPSLLRARGAAGPPAATAMASLTPPLLFDPGQGWEYGVGVDWAGIAVERTTGVPLGRTFADHILGPLGMTDTAFDAHAANPGRFAASHLRQGDGTVVPIPSLVGMPEDWEFQSGGGGLTGTAPDYIRLLRMLLGGGQLDGARILSEATVDSMWRDQAGGLDAGHVDTAMPGLCLPYEPVAGQRGGWSFMGSRNPRDMAGRRRAGSASWVGIAGTFFWIDRESALCGVLMAQLLPFADPALGEAQRAFERAAYAGFGARP